MGRLVTIEMVRDYAGVKREERDPLLERLIAGAERAVEKYTGRLFAPDPPLDQNGGDTAAPVTKEFTTRGQQTVKITDLRVATSVNLGGLALLDDFGYSLAGPEGEPARYIEFGTGAIPGLLNWTPAMKDLTITGRWGYSPTPEDVQDAVASLVARKFKRKDANWADTVQPGPDAAVFQYFKRLPDDIKTTLDSYRDVKVALI